MQCSWTPLWHLETAIHGKRFSSKASSSLGGRNIQRYSVILWMQVDWWGHSNPTYCNQIYLNFFRSDVVGMQNISLMPWCPIVPALTRTTWWNFHYLILVCFVWLNNWDIYCPQTEFGQGNVLTPVCHSGHRGDVMMSLTVMYSTPTPGQHLPPNSTRPLDSTCPQTAPTPWTVPTPWTAPPSSSTRGRYASYWNAF